MKVTRTVTFVAKNVHHCEVRAFPHTTRFCRTLLFPSRGGRGSGGLRGLEWNHGCWRVDILVHIIVYVYVFWLCSHLFDQPVCIIAIRFINMLETCTLFAELQHHPQKMAAWPRESHVNILNMTMIMFKLPAQVPNDLYDLNSHVTTSPGRMEHPSQHTFAFNDLLGLSWAGFVDVWLVHLPPP